MYLDTQYYPRFGLLVIMGTAGLTGFLTSAYLLQAGWARMPLRYAIAATVAYFGFLGLVRLWAKYYRHLHPDIDSVPDVITLGIEAINAVPGAAHFGGGGSFSGGGAGRSFTADRPEPSGRLLDTAPDLEAVADLDESVVWLAPLLLGVALVVGLASTLLVIFGVPALLAEVLLDAGLAGLIYRRLHRYPTRHWLDGVLRRTWKPMLAIAVSLTLAAAVAQYLVPTADSIGDFFR